MTWWRRTLGMDGFDLLIHAGVTSAVLGGIAISGGPEELLPLTFGLSLVVLAVRRHFALRRTDYPGLTSGEMAAERIADLEQRMGELEAAQARLAELEERVDFTERLLARPAEQRNLE
jgi:hypothetical protein